LTGATGSLGIFILSKLSALPSDIVKKIICLVRAENDDMAAQRMFAMASQRGLKVAQEKVGVYAADLAKDGLGMRGPVYATLRDEVDDIIHVSNEACLLELISGGLACAFRKQLDLF